MFLALVRKEIVSHILSLRFGVTFILFILLVFASLYVTTNLYRQDVDAMHARERAAAADIKSILAEEKPRDRYFKMFYDRGRVDAVPPPELSCVAQGIQPAMPAGLRTNRFSSSKLGRSADANPLTGLLPVPDLVYVVGVVLSLLSILFSFDAVCGEKEAGTLRLMMSNSVPRDQVLLAKWLGGYLTLIVPLLVALLGGVLYAWHTGTLRLDGDAWKRLGMLVGLAALSVSVFFTLGLAVSSLTHRAPTALFVCLLIWVVWILVIPNLAPVVAKILTPAPSLLKINQEKQAVREEINLRIQRLTEMSGRLSYGKDVEKEVDKLRREQEQRTNKLDNYYKDSIRRQNELGGVLGRVSPSACWTFAAANLTETGPDAYARVEDASKQLQKEMDELAKTLWVRGRDKDPKPYTADQLPQLRVKGRPAGEAFDACLHDLLILVILNVAFFMTAFVCFLRYDVR